jgi:uncharacterized RDD family membrane protein YckC
MTTEGNCPKPDSVSMEPASLDFLDKESSLLSRASIHSRRNRPVDGLFSDCSARRFWANECDFFLAAISAMMIVIVLPDFDPMLKGLSFYLFYLLYYQFTEYIGATPAKWWFGLCVRSLDGRRASFLQIGIRTLFRVLEANPLLLGFLPAGLFVLFTRRHVRLGDWLAGTVVIRTDYLNSIVRRPTTNESSDSKAEHSSVLVVASQNSRRRRNVDNGTAFIVVIAIILIFALIQVRMYWFRPSFIGEY